MTKRSIAVHTGKRILVTNPTDPQPVPPGDFSWRILKIGAGGFITGMDIAGDGTKVCRTDTYGGYFYSGGSWNQIVTTTSMGASDSGEALGEGIYEIVICPSTTSRFYMAYYGYVYRSDNQGGTWTRTNFTQLTHGGGGSMDPNDGSSNTYPKLHGPKMAVDPVNANVCYIGTGANGMFKTADAGATWTADSGVAVSSNTKGIIITFDPSSAVVGGKTQGIYAASYGNGVYHSTNGGTSWTLTTGTPTTHNHIVCNSAGKVFLTPDDGTNNIKIYNGSSWSSVSTNAGSQGIHGVAIDPANAARITVCNPGGQPNTSIDSGATWGGFAASLTQVTTELPWIGTTNNAFMSCGTIIYDPTSSNKLYLGSGIGVWYGAPPNDTSVMTWTVQSVAIEELVSNDVVVPLSGKPVCAFWDKPLFYIGNTSTYSAVFGPNSVAAINGGWSIDYASSDPTFICAIINGFATDQSCYSTDGGQTWTEFTTKNAGIAAGYIGGSIAASSPLNMVWVNSNGGFPYYTVDGGDTWNLISPAGVPTSPSNPGWNQSYYLSQQIVAADRVTAGKFYMYNCGTSSGLSFAGLYSSVDSGVTFTRVFAGQIEIFSNNQAKLKAVPNNAGHLFFTTGPIGAAGTLYRSTDSGVNWTAVPNTSLVYDMGFGAAAPSGSYPAVFFYGRLSGVLGVWRSDDNCATWTSISDGFPLGIFSATRCIAGDLSTYGKCYVGFGGCAFAYYGTS